MKKTFVLFVLSIIYFFMPVMAQTTVNSLQMESAQNITMMKERYKALGLNDIQVDSVIAISNDFRQKALGNPVIHFEVGCKDIAKTTEFYTSLFGWTPTPATMASYINTNSTEGIQGHITSLGHEPYNYVTFYIQVDDIADCLARIQKAGGQKVVGPIKLPTSQQFAWFKDLDGNLIGLLTKLKN